MLLHNDRKRFRGKSISPSARRSLVWLDCFVGSRFLLLAIGLAGVCRPAFSLQNSSPADLGSRLLPLIESHEGRIAVAVQHLGTGESFFHNADQPMPTASLIKFPLMVAAHEKISRGELSLDQRIVLKEADKVPGSGILTDHFSAGADLSLRDLIRLMIVYSDNTATNLVAEQVGLISLNAWLEQLGMQQTRMNSLVYRRDLSIDPARSEQFGLGSTTAREIARLFELLERGQVVSPEACEAMKSPLLACDDGTKLKRFLPASVLLAHKSGEVSASRCEGGLIYGATGPIAICVLTTENANQDFADDHPAHVLIGRIAEQSWLYFNPETESSTAGGALAAGAGGELVADLQRTLNARLQLQPPLSVDGDFGPATEAAVKRFQSANGLEPTGTVDSAVWDRLGSLVTEEAVPDPAAVNAERESRASPDWLEGPPLVTAAAWVVMDGETGKVLAGHQDDARRAVASTTKLMTARLILKLAAENRSVLDERVTFSRAAFETEGSAAGLREGESATVGELLYGLLLPSGNDAAVAMAEHFGPRLSNEPVTALKASGGQAQFVAAMNAEAASLGMDETHYCNPNGLPDPRHLGSARDLARLAFEAWKSDDLRRIVSTRRFGCTVQGADGHRRNVLWENTNRLLAIEGYDGMKTGSTQSAGACLVAHAQRGTGQRIVVVLGCPCSESRYTDARNLFRWSWSLLNPE